MKTAAKVSYQAISPSSGSKFYWLEAMRGIAAIWVLLHHAAPSTDAFIGKFGSATIIENGYLGVDFFFVLSGFIISYSVKVMEPRGVRVLDYLSLRAIRVYVPYLPVGIGMLLLYQILPGVSGSDRDVSAITSITLVPDFNPPALAVAWTLVHELIFYAVFAIWFYSRKALYAALFFWLILILVVHFGEMRLNRVSNYFFSPLNFCFMLGVCVQLLNERLRQKAAPCFAALLAGFCIVIFQSTALDVSRLSAAIGFSLVILGVTSDLAQTVRPAKVLVLLGAASYSVYLVHGPVLSVLSRAWGSLRFDLGLNSWTGFCFISLGALLAGVLYWWFYERPVLKLARAALVRVNPTP